MARIVQFHRTGAPEVLKIEEVPTPQPGPGEVRIKVEAIGLNRAESLYRQGKYIEEPLLPSKLGYEAAGIIDAIGEGVVVFKKGDRVSTMPTFSFHHYGVYGDYAIVPIHAISKYPDNLTPAEASAIWVQYLTAYFGLIELADLRRGQTILITAATSIVGGAAIQIAKSIGAKVIGTTRSPEKEKGLIEVGADEVIVTTSEKLVERAMNITHGKGVDVIFDSIAGPGVEEFGDIIKPHGSIIIYGSLSPEPTVFPLRQAFVKNFSFFVFSIFDFCLGNAKGTYTQPEALGRAHQFIIDALKTGKLRPILDKTFPLENIVEAHRYLESNQQKGKIIVTV